MQRFFYRIMVPNIQEVSLFYILLTLWELWTWKKSNHWVLVVFESGKTILSNFGQKNQGDKWREGPSDDNKKQAYKKGSKHIRDRRFPETKLISLEYWYNKDYSLCLIITFTNDTYDCKCWLVLIYPYELFTFKLDSY